MVIFSDALVGAWMIGFIGGTVAVFGIPIGLACGVVLRGEGSGSVHCGGRGGVGGRSFDRRGERGGCVSCGRRGTTAVERAKRSGSCDFGS